MSVNCSNGNVLTYEIFNGTGCDTKNLFRRGMATTPGHLDTRIPLTPNVTVQGINNTLVFYVGDSTIVDRLSLPSPLPVVEKDNMGSCLLSNGKIYSAHLVCVNNQSNTNLYIVLAAVALSVILAFFCCFKKRNNKD
ncbi:hypothetical protein HDV02_001501 [Globomyces sp. JEL0801]|nr:hypothetical protein HDV02_001501 [Globomyces sp. JEL0801]